MNLFRKSITVLLGCALFATTTLVADAGFVSQVALLTFAGAAGVVIMAEESPRVLQAEVVPDRFLQMEPSFTPTASPSGSSADAPTNSGAAMFVGGGVSKAVMSCALAALAGGAMAVAAV